MVSRRRGADQRPHWVHDVQSGMESHGGRSQRGQFHVGLAGTFRNRYIRGDHDAFDNRVELHDERVLPVCEPGADHFMVRASDPDQEL